nr:prolyl oligopeptidase family serine peptidase [Candidatus Delongbacteria bacterium]
ILNGDQVGNLTFSPDGEWVMFINRIVDTKENKRLGQVFLQQWNRQAKPVRITDEKFSAVKALFSPDGKQVAVLGKSSDQKTLRLYLKQMPAGALMPLITRDDGIEDFAWLDSSRLIVQAEDKTLVNDIRKENKDDAFAFEDSSDYTFNHLYRVDIGTRQWEIVEGSFRGKIEEFAVSPVGDYILLRLHTSPRQGNDLRVWPEYWQIDLRNHTSRRVFETPYFLPEHFQWSPDGQTCYFVEDSTNFEAKLGRGVVRLFAYRPSDGSCRNVGLDWDHGVGSNYYTPFSVSKRGVLTTLAHGVINRALQIEGDRKSRLKGEIADHLEQYTLSKDGRWIFYLTSTAQSLPRLQVGEIRNGEIKPLKTILELHSHLKDKFIAKREIIRWNSEQNRSIEGILYYPKDYQSGKRYPLLINIHGGPYGVDMDYFELGWGYYPHYLAERGNLVLFVNYSGSSNYGLEFAESIYGKYYELEIPDIWSGVSELERRGMLDTSRIGTMGWSNGSILSIGLCLEKGEAVKVACCGAGDVNWTSDYGNCRFGVSFDQLYFGGAPWDHTEHYIAKSPLFRMQKVVTPTIIFFGTEDSNVPPEQGYEHYRAMQQIGKAPVRMVLFPGEPHGFMQYSHQKRKVEEELAWLNRYFWRRPTEKKEIPEWVAAASPLYQILKKNKVLKKVGSEYGIRHEQVLIPQMAELDSGRIANCEVTVAQWNAFCQVTAQYQPLTAPSPNWPAYSITATMAMDYCAWLSRVTGQSYTLPPADRFRKLLSHVSPDTENTLAYWLKGQAGIQEIEPMASLLDSLELIREVACFTGSSDDCYDLNGNVSEWVLDAHDQPILMGHSALSSGNPDRPKETSSNPRYRGFRVFCRN